MMRYQRVSSPDVLPLGNGKKPSLRACKEDYADDGGRIQNYSLFEIKSSRRRPASGSENPSPIRDHHFPHIFFPSDSPPAAHSDTQPSAPSTSASPGPAKAQSQHQINGGSHGGGSDVLLRWGHKKRSRGPRTEGRAPAAGEASSVQSRPVVKVQRRSSGAMPPPSGPHARVANLGEGMPGRDATASLVNGGGKERSGAPTRSEKRSPRRPSKKAQKASANPTPNGGSGTADGYANPEAKQPSDPPEAGSGAGMAVAATTEKLNPDHFQWPRIYISLSRKEKEDDFLAMKGTKLPQRPKKRAKNIDRTLQYCFPGMWLSDLTRGRYEVREKKCAKKQKLRGLKGMESMHSDSE